MIVAVMEGLNNVMVVGGGLYAATGLAVVIILFPWARS